MKVAKVIGNIWATRKEEKLAGYKLLIVQPINILDGSMDKPPWWRPTSWRRCGRDGVDRRRELGPERCRGHVSPC